MQSNTMKFMFIIHRNVLKASFFIVPNHITFPPPKTDLSTFDYVAWDSVKHETRNRGFYVMTFRFM
jgi:hypothetical protein